MLQAINDRIKGWLGIAVVTLIALPFAFWGIQSYTGDGVQQYAAKIDDIEISARVLDYNVSIQRQRLLEQYNGRLPFEESQLKEQVLDQLINQKLIELVSHQNGYRISDTELSNNIKKLFTRDGAFNRIMYDSVRQSQGKSAAQFENDLRNEMRVIQMRDGIVSTCLASNAEARKIVELESQTREASLITFGVDNFSKDILIEDQEIKDAYDAGYDRYTTPEKVSIEYVELKSDALSDAVIINEQQIKDMYDKYVESLSQREKRKASHILLKAGSNKETTKGRLEDFKQQLESGAKFEDIAREYSEDIVSAKQGGDLGWVEPGQMVKPFEDALFTLKEGEISNIVESPFGLHLIKLDEVQQIPLKPLAEMRGEFERTLKQDSASSMFYDLSETMATAAFENPDGLDAVIDQLNVELQVSDFFTRDSGEGIASNELIRKAAFAPSVLEQGNNSDIIQVSPDHIVVLRTRQYQESSMRPLDEVKLDIENVLRLRRGHDQALAAALAAKDKIESGQSVSSVLSSGQNIQKPGPVTRKEATRVDPKILKAMFSMPHPEDGRTVVKNVVLDSGDVVLVILDKVNKPKSVEQSRVVTVLRQLKTDTALREFSAMLNAIKDSTDISKNPKVFQ